MRGEHEQVCEVYELYIEQSSGVFNEADLQIFYFNKKTALRQNLYQFLPPKVHFDSYRLKWYCLKWAILSGAINIQL